MLMLLTTVTERPQTLQMWTRRQPQAATETRQLLQMRVVTPASSAFASELVFATDAAGKKPVAKICCNSDTCLATVTAVNSDHGGLNPNKIHHHSFAFGGKRIMMRVLGNVTGKAQPKEGFADNLIKLLCDMNNNFKSNWNESHTDGAHVELNESEGEEGDA